jgi:lincosamide nucleotidyltransferase A/C/D/E
MLNPGDVSKLYRQLTQYGIQVWLCGGWGIDALLGEHNRPHKDLDILMLVEDVSHMCALLSQDGWKLKELWPENKWVVDSNGVRIATGFVLHDS